MSNDVVNLNDWIAERTRRSFAKHSGVTIPEAVLAEEITEKPNEIGHKCTVIRPEEITS